MLKSLQDRPARFARAGKIKLGIKVAGHDRNGNPIELPRDVEYFVLPEELRRAHGDRPLSLPCRLPYDDPSMVFDASYQKWNGADLAVRCDEQTCVTRDPKTGKPDENPCQKPEGVNECPCGAKPMGRLLLLVPGGFVGVYELRITGYSRISILWDQIKQFREIFGRLREIPFFITREARDSSYFKDGKSHTREIHPVALKCEWATLQQFAAGRQLAAAPAPEALPPAAAPEADDAPETADGAGEVETAVITQAPARPTVAVPEQLPFSQEVRVEPAVAPGPQTAATQALGDQREARPPLTDWDVSMCVMSAVKTLGLTKEVYLRYLHEVYGGEDQMDAFMISEQADLLQRSGRDRKVAENLKKAIEMAAKGRLSPRR